METRRLLKQRLAVFLSIAMAFTMLLGTTPQMQTTAEAASTQISIYGRTGITYDYMTDARSYIFAMEAKQKVILGKLFWLNITKSDGSGSSYRNISSVSGVRYSLDDTKLATLNTKTGELKTKSAGIVQGTIKYGSTSQRFVVQILSAGKLGTNSAKYNTMRNLIKQVKKFNKKITSKNRYDYVTTENKYELEREKRDLNTDGIRDGKGKYKIGNATYTTTSMSYLILPEMAGMQDEFADLYTYCRKYNPVGTISGKYFKIKSVNAKKNTKNFTIVLTRNVNADQIFAIKATESGDTIVKNDKTAVFPLYVKDKKTGYRYAATAVAKEGSNKITVKMKNLKFNSKDTYQLLSNSYWYRPGVKKYDWTGWKTFKAK